MNYDPLTEFHLNNQDYSIYVLLEKLLTILERSINIEFLHPQEKKEINKQIQKMINDSTGKKILELICLRKNMDFKSLLISINKNSDFNIVEVLQILFLSEVNFSIKVASDILGVDKEEAEEAVLEFKKNLRIDNLIVWLKGFLSDNNKHKEHLIKDQVKQEVLLGKDVSQVPVDTAEARKNKDRRSNIKAGDDKV